jgi:hypothetical protein
LDIGKEAGSLFVDPLDEVLVVVFVGGDVPFSYVVGSTGAVDAINARLLEEEVLEGFLHLLSLDRVLHVVPAEASDGYVVVVFHVLILFAKELDVGLRVFATKGEGDKEVVMNG